MEASQIKESLRKKFNPDHPSDRKRLVFWNDPEGEFLELVVSGDVVDEGVTILNLAEMGGLEAKVLMELKNPEAQYLVYSPRGEPEHHEDGLLDLRLDGKNARFRADKSSMVLAELGLDPQSSLKEHIEKRGKFFDAKDRRAKLKKLITAGDTDDDLDRKMIAVLSKAERPEFNSILRTLYHSMAEGDDIRANPGAWDAVEKFELADAFWKMVEGVLGYPGADETPSLYKLLICLLVSDLAWGLSRSSADKKDLPQGLANHELSRSGQEQAHAFLTQWRDSKSKGRSYDRCSRTVGNHLEIKKRLKDYEVEALREVTTFVEVEGLILAEVSRRVVSGASVGSEIDFDWIQEITDHRLHSGHWALSSTLQDAPKEALQASYEALLFAAEFFEMRNAHQDGFGAASTAAELYQAYENELYRFDQLYRWFCERALTVAAHSWDRLRDLQDKIEHCYTNWFLTNLSLAWDSFLDSGLLDEWKINRPGDEESKKRPPVTSQQSFYRERVDSPELLRSKKPKVSRVFVIISDALRYEVAQELFAELNRTSRVEAELSTQLGVLPSYTALGMASLLPHESLEYSEDSNGKPTVLVNGRSTSGVVNRNEILEAVDGIAVKAQDLQGMTKDEGVQLTQPAKVVYVYHDDIDSTGDRQATEDDTFKAAREAVTSLANLVEHIGKNLNTSNILVTADHGFLFRQRKLSETDRSKLPESILPAGRLLAKKRYLLGRNLGTNDRVFHGNTSATAGAEGDMEFWIPKSTNRFHYVGGAKFVHGGAALQEIVVPVIKVKYHKSKGKSAEATEVSRVPVQVEQRAGESIRITTAAHRFTLLQTQVVEGRVQPRTLKVGVKFENEWVTSVETVIFNSESSNLEDLKQDVVLTLGEHEFDRGKPYRLVLEDFEDGIEHCSVDVIIDRAIADDF